MAIKICNNCEKEQDDENQVCQYCGGEVGRVCECGNEAIEDEEVVCLECR